MGDKTKRQRAYKFIKDTIESKAGKIPEGADEIVELHNVLGGTLELGDFLEGLKDGRLDPADKLVEAFRQFVGPLVPEFEISGYLVEPFKSDP